MIYTGEGEILFKNQLYKGYIELDPENEEIRAKIPQDREVADYFSILQDSSIFEDDYSIENFSCNLPNGKIFTDKIQYLLLRNLNPGSLSVFDSTLVRSFSLAPKNIGITTLSFIPQKFILSFDFESQDKIKDNSELILYNHKIKKLVSFKIGKKKLSVNGDNNYLIINSNINLLKYRNDLETAISIFQGGRCVYRTGFFNNKLELSFNGIDKKPKPYGSIFQEEDYISEFFTKYFVYIKSLKQNDKNKIERFLNYLLDSCNQNVFLENRTLNLMTALEIIDTSKTLNKNTLSKILNISKNHADFIKRVRNKLIHEGKSLKESIYISINEIKSNVPDYKAPFDKRIKSKAPSKFYFWALTKIYQYFLREIGMSSLQIEYHKHY